VICEKCEPIIANYNALIIHPKSKPVAQPIVIYIITKQQLVQIVVKQVMPNKPVTIGKEKNI
jgi:hypothetical protein